MQKQIRVVPVVLASVAAAAILGVVGVAANLIPLPARLRPQDTDIL